MSSRICPMHQIRTHLGHPICPPHTHPHTTVHYIYTPGVRRYAYLRRSVYLRIYGDRSSIVQYTLTVLRIRGTYSSSSFGSSEAESLFTKLEHVLFVDVRKQLVLPHQRFIECLLCRNQVSFQSIHAAGGCIE